MYFCEGCVQSVGVNVDLMWEGMNGCVLLRVAIRDLALLMEALYSSSLK